MTCFVQDKLLTVALSGEIDHHHAKGLMDATANKIEEYSPSCCILDFKDVGFMDSSGIALVIHTMRRMREIGGTLQIKHVSGQVYKVLAAAGVNRIVSLEGSCNFEDQ